MESKPQHEKKLFSIANEVLHSVSVLSTSQIRTCLLKMHEANSQQKKQRDWDRKITYQNPQVMLALRNLLLMVDKLEGMSLWSTPISAICKACTLYTKNHIIEKLHSNQKPSILGMWGDYVEQASSKVLSPSEAEVYNFTISKLARDYFDEKERDAKERESKGVIRAFDPKKLPGGVDPLNSPTLSLMHKATEARQQKRMATGHIPSSTVTTMMNPSRPLKDLRLSPDDKKTCEHLREEWSSFVQYVIHHWGARLSRGMDQSMSSSSYRSILDTLDRLTLLQLADEEGNPFWKNLPKLDILCGYVSWPYLGISQDCLNSAAVLKLRAMASYITSSGLKPEEEEFLSRKAAEMWQSFMDMCCGPKTARKCGFFKFQMFCLDGLLSQIRVCMELIETAHELLFDPIQLFNKMIDTQEVAWRFEDMVPELKRVCTFVKKGMSRNMHSVSPSMKQYFQRLEKTYSMDVLKRDFLPSERKEEKKEDGDKKKEDDEKDKTDRKEVKWPPIDEKTTPQSGLPDKDEFLKVWNTYYEAKCNFMANDILLSWEEEESTLGQWLHLLEKGEVTVLGRCSSLPHAHTQVIIEALSRDRYVNLEGESSSSSSSSHIAIPRHHDDSKLLQQSCSHYSSILSDVQSMWMYQLRDMAIAATLHHVSFEVILAACESSCQKRRDMVVHEIKRAGKMLQNWSQVARDVYGQMNTQLSKTRVDILQQMDQVYSKYNFQFGTEPQLNLDARLILRNVVSKTLLPLKIFIQDWHEKNHPWFQNMDGIFELPLWLDVSKLDALATEIMNMTDPEMNILLVTNLVFNWMVVLAALDFLRCCE